MKLSGIIVAMGAALAVAAPNPKPDAASQAYGPVQSVAHQAWKRAAVAEPAGEAYPVQSVSKSAWKRHVERDAEPEAAPAPVPAPGPAPAAGAVSDVEYVKRHPQPDAAAAAPYPVQSVSHSAWKRTIKRDAAAEAVAEPMMEMGSESLEVLTA